MQPIEAAPAGVLAGIDFLFSDIDDTLTDDGRLPAASYEALWLLHERGVKLVPVTGRPAGWCDFFARMWPVDAVVGENGAFFFSYDRGLRRMRREYLMDRAQRLENERRLALIRDEILAEVPGAAVSADQAYRLADLAIDFREDVEPLGERELERICAVARRHGAEYKVSSIHVNIWFGAYDKLACMRRYLQSMHGLDLDAAQSRLAFVGDSPNDEPMFAGVANSIGVANIRNFLPRISHPPRYLTRGESARGFREAADLILAAKSAKV